MRWEVTDQRKTARVGDNGVPVPGVDVTVTTDTGHVETVFVPQSDYTVEGVTRAVTDVLTPHNAIANLTGEV